MDSAKAYSLETLLKGESISGYEISQLLNHGKSAAVFKGFYKDGQSVAIKIFDNELIARFGDDLQKIRMERETGLKDHSVSGLVHILDGGEADIKGEVYHYIIMEFVEGKNLKQYIETENYNEDFIRNVLLQLFNVSESLLNLQIVHRDIKPENIMVSSGGKIVLMDLGVIKIIGSPSYTDVERLEFIGTLQYAPPEYLMRNEADTPDGWKAVNLYQLGAVLHDLIMKKELFSGISPYPKIVISVKEDAPNISNKNFAFDLQQLARDLLIKNPLARIKSCTNDRISAVATGKSKPTASIDLKIDTVKQLTAENSVRLMAIEDIKRSNAEKATKRQEIITEIEKTIRKAMQNLALTGLFNECKCSPGFSFVEDAHDKTLAYKSLLFKLPSDLHKGFPGGFYLLFRFSTDESGFITISSIGFFLGAFVDIVTLEMPHQIIKQIVKSQPLLRNINRLQASELSPLPDLQITFSGSFSKGVDILDFLKIKIVGLIYKAVSDVQPDVESLLSFHENRAMGISKTFVRSGPPRIYHCDLD